MALTLLAACVCATVAAVPGVARPKPPVDRVQVRGVEFDLTLSRDRVAPGRVLVQFVNAGEDAHDLQLQRVSHGSPAGPRRGLGEVSAGEYANLEARLRRGSRYRLWCSLRDHRQLGMEATLKVARHRG